MIGLNSTELIIDSIFIFWNYFGRYHNRKFTQDQQRVGCVCVSVCYETNWKQFRSTNEYTRAAEEPMHENKPQIFIFLLWFFSLCFFVLLNGDTEKMNVGCWCFCCCRLFFGIVENLFGVGGVIGSCYCFQILSTYLIRFRKNDAQPVHLNGTNEMYICFFLYQFITNDFCFVWFLLVNPQRTYFISFHFSFVINQRKK